MLFRCAKLFFNKQVYRAIATTQPHSLKLRHDVLISGGGVVGGMLAADILHRTGGTCSVGIVETTPPKPLPLYDVNGAAAAGEGRGVPDVRVYALSPRSVALLRRVGAWRYIEPRSQPYHFMQVWEAAGPGMLRFSAADVLDTAGAAAGEGAEAHEEELGRICEDRVIQSALYQAIADMGYMASFGQDGTVVTSEPPGPELAEDPASTAAAPAVPGLTTYYGWSVRDFACGDLGGPAIVRLQGTQAQGTKGSVKGVEVEGKGGEGVQDADVSCRLLVGADGGNSAVRRLAGILTWGWSYGQEAVVATVRLPSPNSTAWQKYLHTGPLALLPLWDGYASIVWSVPAPEARRLKSLSDAEFLESLNCALQTPPATDAWSVLEPGDGSSSFDPAGGGAASTLLGGILGPARAATARVVREAAAVADTVMAAGQMRDPLQYPPPALELASARLSFPLSLQQARHYAIPSLRVALVGDAAHSIHPQAGQGLNLGLQDASCLAELLEGALSVGADCGAAGTVLLPYARDRYAKNLLMMGAVDAVNSVFKDAQLPPGMMAARGRAGEKEEEDGAGDKAWRGALGGGGAAALKGLEGLEKGKRLVRSMGMLGLHQLGPLKKQIAKFAMGL